MPSAAHSRNAIGSLEDTSILPAPLAHALQPIVDARSGVVYAYEALLRGTPEAGFATIGAFFDDAHERNQLLAVEHGLQAMAMATFRRLPHREPKKLFLNIDNRVLNDPAFNPVEVALIADRMGVPRSSVVLELSEKSDLGSVASSHELVRALRGFGLRIAVDDFGQGFSELKLLHDAAPEYVKIDRFFISGLESLPRKRLFVATVVNLAHMLGAKVVAEGVETQEEFMACQRIGCDLIQGWYVARPTRDLQNAPNVYPVMRGLDGEIISRPSDADLISAELDRLEPLRIDDGLVSVFDRLRARPEADFFPVVDETDEPLGLVHERDLREFMYGPFGRDILTNPSYGRHLRDFVVRAPVVDISSVVETLLESAALSSGKSGVIITDKMRYVGVLSSGALLKILNEKRITVAQDQNPLSRLPGNAMISAYIGRQIGDRRARRAFCHFDFNHFKPFNDTYGFRQGDRAIMLFADILRDHFKDSGYFIGHIGGDDFFLGARADAAASMAAAANAALEDFRHQIESFYDPEARARGAIEAPDRNGQPNIYPLMTCSAGIVELPAGHVVDGVDDLYRLIADAKRKAKITPNGIAVLRA